MSKANASTSDRQQQTTQTAASEQVFTFWQAAAIVPSTLLGVGVLTLPRELALATDSNSFLPMLVSGAFFLFVVWMITKLGQRFSGLTIVGYTQKLLTFAGNQRIGRVLAFPVLAVVGIWWLLSVAAALRIFGEAQRSVVFPDTPLWFIVGTMLFVSALVAANRAEVIARLNEFLLPIIVIPLVLIVILALDNAEWTNLLPLVEMSWGEFWRGVLQSFFAYQGVSVIAVFMASYQQPEKAVRSHFTGIGIMIVVYLMVTMTTMAAFPHQEVERLMWPTLELVKL
ncbi:MAG: spore germination protein, partial [Novibacillus thermophilus]